MLGFSGSKQTEPQCQKMYLRTCAPNEYSDQPAHSRRLIRIFNGRILDSKGCKVSSCRQQCLLSVCVDVQADSSFRWADMPEGTISDVAV